MKRTKKREEKRGVKAKICDALEIPSDVLTDVPRFTINDNRELWIENYKCVLEYDDNAVRLAAKNYEIKISGTKLLISCITDEQIFIRGRISSIEYVYQRMI